VEAILFIVKAKVTFSHTHIAYKTAQMCNFHAEKYALLANFSYICKNIIDNGFTKCRLPKYKE
jgi:hypothetical protein